MIALVSRSDKARRRLRLLAFLLAAASWASCLRLDKHERVESKRIINDIHKQIGIARLCHSCQYIAQLVRSRLIPSAG